MHATYIKASSSNKSRHDTRKHLTLQAVVAPALQLEFSRPGASSEQKLEGMEVEMDVEG